MMEEVVIEIDICGFFVFSGVNFSVVGEGVSCRISDELDSEAW